MLAFEYTVGPEEHLKHQRLLNPSVPREAIAANRRTTVNGLLVLGFAMYAAWEARLIALLAGFLCATAFLIFYAATYSGRYWKQLGVSLKSLPSKRVRLEVRADGRHETTEGVQSFAPWHAVIGYSVFGDVLFVELAGRLWAMIPEPTLSASSSSLTQLLEALKEDGVKERLSGRIAASTD
jgi:hypothetical protein